MTIKRLRTLAAEKEEKLETPKPYDKKNDVGADDIPQWFSDMTVELQKKYLYEHPNSKISHAVKNRDKDIQPNDKGVMRKAADHVKKATETVKDHAKRINKEQQQFFGRGDDEPGSNTRRTLGKYFKDKAKGLVKGAKHEVKEWRMAGTALRKLVNMTEIDHHEKAALKAVATHAALVVIPMALSGGLSAGFTHVAPALAMSFLEHSLAIIAGKVALFAEVDKTSDDPETDELLEQLMEKFGEYVANGDIDWAKLFADSEPKHD